MCIRVLERYTKHVSSNEFNRLLTRLTSGPHNFFHNQSKCLCFNPLHRNQVLQRPPAVLSSNFNFSCNILYMCLFFLNLLCEGTYSSLVL